MDPVLGAAQGALVPKGTSLEDRDSVIPAWQEGKGKGRGILLCG